jgi:sulfite reductase (NADPH) flavoprotein alpha-component
MVIDKSHPFSSKIKERFPLTKEGSTKETYHISLDITGSKIEFKPGDSIGIFAQNDPTLVEHLLTAMRAKGDEPILDKRSETHFPIREFLQRKANLSRLTSSFLKLFYEHAQEHNQKNALHRLLQEENRVLLTQYLALHDPLDLIKEYQGVETPLQSLCEQFGPLLPRFYSVASSRKTFPNEVHLTVALSTFTHGGERRFGVASHFLCHLADLTTEIPIYVQPAHGFFLPPDPATPIIMVGPGTGIAPYRAFLQERIAEDASGQNWLFFGERNRQTDFFYEDYWNGLIAQKKLRLDLAFSRDQPEKLYVQHRLQENAAAIYDWIQQGAYFYVCGDAHRMAKDVDATLLQIFRQQGNLDEAGAKAHLKQLKQLKRYQLDVY